MITPFHHCHIGPSLGRRGARRELDFPVTPGKPSKRFLNRVFIHRSQSLARPSANAALVMMEGDLEARHFTKPPPLFSIRAPLKEKKRRAEN